MSRRRRPAPRPRRCCWKQPHQVAESPYNILFRDDKSYPYIIPSGTLFRGWAFSAAILTARRSISGRIPRPGRCGTACRPCKDVSPAHLRGHRLRQPLAALPALLQIRRCSGPRVGHITAEDYAWDVQLAAMFLHGRQQEVIKRLTRSMEEASARLAFEMAAIYRDQIQSLRQVQEKQFVSSAKGEDVDVVVALRDAGQLCVNPPWSGAAAPGDRPQFPTNAGDSTSADAVAAFLQQHYAVHPAPARIFVSPHRQTRRAPTTRPSWPNLQAAPFRCSEPRSVVHRTWVEMALQNARLAIVARNQATAQQEQRLAALQEALGLAEPAAAYRMLRYQPHPGRGDGGVVCVSRQRHEEIRLPALQYPRHRSRRRLRRHASGGQPTLRQRGEWRRHPAGPHPHRRRKGRWYAHEALADLGLAALGLVGVAKGEERKPGLESLIFPDGRQPLQLPPEHPALHLIQEIATRRTALPSPDIAPGGRRRVTPPDWKACRASVRRGAKPWWPSLGAARGAGGQSGPTGGGTGGISRELAAKIYAALH